MDSDDRAVIRDEESFIPSHLQGRFGSGSVTVTSSVFACFCMGFCSTVSLCEDTVAQSGM